ncbi:MAG: hypothetical protein JSV53_03485 [candidate division WOR-3 bacterium]|nr:MAG: hypothetical protein JSV53_03485 [candidate division WOR-3 bacterium]
MKKLFLYLVLSCILVLSCGGEEYTRLNAFFGEQPEGGTDVTELRCVVVGRLEGGDTPIQARLEAWWAENIGQNEELYGYDTWTFRLQEYEELRIIVQPPAGYILMGHFWFYCFWTDEDGTHHEMWSDTAYCHN